MFKKKKIMPIIIIVFVGLAGFIKINIINTKALSPIGNAKDNYALVSEEFGEDFTEFIKDNAQVKIYAGDGNEDSTIRVNEKEFRLKKENPFLIVAARVGTKIKDGFVSVKEKIDSKVTDINNNNEQKDDVNSELDKTVDDFIEKRDKSLNNLNDEEDTINKKNTTDVNDKKQQ